MLRTILVFLAIAVAVVIFFEWSFGPDETESEIGFGDLVRDARLGLVETIEVKGDAITATYFELIDNEPVVKDSRISQDLDIASFLKEEGIAITRTDAQSGDPAVNLLFKEDSGSGMTNLLGWLLTLAPIGLMVVFIWLIFRQTRGTEGRAIGFGRSSARLITPNEVGVTFADVAGVDEAKAELSEIVGFLKSPEKFAKLGARIPKGLLLLGPPGTGKTLLARAVAGEAGVPFFSVSGSEFVELFVGVGASRVRDLFDQAKKNAPCIVFLDEIDAVGRQRGAGLGGGNDEREQTLNQILVEMDGFERGLNVVVLAATNRPDILDPALLRPGRFDRKIILDAPDVRGREAILRVHLKGKPLESDVSVESLAKTTPGFTGADIANLVNEAALLAARRDGDAIAMKDFGEAVDRVIAGPERKSRLMTPQERRLTAYHEGGHALVAHFLKHHDRPNKVTIVSRGMAGGYTRFMPEEEVHFRTPSMFKDQLCTALAGRAAEELVFGEASTGPSNDLEQLTRIARSMVMRWGMSERLGPRTFGRTEELVFLGREISETRDYSERIAEEIDEEVQRLVLDQAERATNILVEHRDRLDRLAEALLEEETIEGDALLHLLQGEVRQPRPVAAAPGTPVPDAADPASAPPPAEVHGLAWGSAAPESEPPHASS
jgi:cell division protease FtsH